MSKTPKKRTPTSKTRALEKANPAPIIVVWLLAAATAGAAIYQTNELGQIRVENATLSAKLETSQTDLMRTTTKLEDAQTRVLDLTGKVASIDREQVALLEQNLATAVAEGNALRAELAAAQGALTAKDAEIAELANNILPRPPTTEMLAPPPLYATANFGDPHVEIPLDQYLSELLTTLADDSKAPGLEAIHPLGVLYDLDSELLLQGTVGVSPRYRVTEWHTFNEYQDIVLDSLVVIDAPAGTNATTRIQQALTSARGAGDLNDEGLLTWEIGNKTITLLSTSDTARAMLHVSDSYQLLEMMQVYNRQ